MKRVQRAGLGLFAVTLLSSCGTAPIDMKPDNSWLSQYWTVTEASPLAEGISTPPVGRFLYLGPANTGDLSGQTCAYTDINFREMPLSEALGGAESETLLDRAVTVATFKCAGLPWGTYARTAESTLITRSGPWLLWLKPSKSLVTIPYLMKTP
jgi:hypothetical protein